MKHKVIFPLHRTKCYYIIALFAINLNPFVVQNLPAVTSYDNSSYTLLPQPREITYSEGSFKITPGKLIFIDNQESEDVFIAGQSIQESISDIGFEWKLTASLGINESEIGASVLIDPDKIPYAQGYQLIISHDKIDIRTHDAAGCFYAAQTLKQICRQASTEKGLICMTIVDWPDFPARGLLLDVSRDKIPTMKTLYRLVDMLSEWKINQLQLYTEHAFAYQNHKAVWQGSSPMTAEEVIRLDRYCKERFVELVPNQNSFGHMSRWFEHEEYRHLAELDLGDGFKTGGMGHFSVSPAVPESFDFISGLHDELIPNFTSSMINVCCDETSDLGKGKSAELCDKYGKGRVYLDFLMKIYEHVKKHGKTMQFWCDIIVHHPELASELPKDIIALVWGYYYDEPRLDYAESFESLNIPFYMCPGTCTWNSFTGRTENLLFNHRKAATLGLKHHAAGYLNTNWGDHGHWQPLSVCYTGFAYGAAISWAVEQNYEIDLPAVLSAHAFYDESGIMGKLVYDLGNTYLQATTPAKNPELTKNKFYRLLFFPENSIKNEGTEGILTVETLENAIKYIDNTLAEIENSRMKCRNSQQVIDELRQAGNVVKHCCRQGIERLKVKDLKISNIPVEERKKLAEELRQIINEHQRLWVVRNRIGGLDNSVEWAMDALRLYEAK
jgi:hexosaminidase